MENSPHLSPLMEVSGVEAVFALDPAGRLVAVRTAPIFTPEILQRAGNKIATLLDALSEYLRPSQEATLVFEHHVIIIRRRDALILAVLAQAIVNQVALKLAGNLCLKRLAEPVATPVVPAAPAPAAAPVPKPQPAARPATPFSAPAKAPSPAAVKPPANPPKRGGGIWG